MMNLVQVWQAALGIIQLQMSRHEFETWLQETTLLSLDSGVATISTPSTEFKEALEGQHLGLLRRALGDVIGTPVQVRCVITPPTFLFDETPAHEHEHDDPVQTEPPLPDKVPTTELFNVRMVTDAEWMSAADQNLIQLDFAGAIRAGMFNPKYTFAHFIVGSSNRFAHAACVAVAEQPAHSYNPLFLYGGVGLGKTHLLHAIGNAVLDRDPEINVLYVSSEKFTNDLINAIRRQQADEFRIRYRNIDVLLVDDIQFIAGKDATQEEFFHTFNTLHAASKQIVISSDRPPKAIVTLEERLRSRFEWGLIADVQPPDLETRTAILRSKAEHIKLSVPNEVIDFLAHKIQSNIRELEGCLNRVEAFAELHHIPITIDVATAALSELLENTYRKRITPEMVLEEVCEYYSIDLPTLRSRGRSRTIVVPRHIVMYLLREETGCSLMEIGHLLGGRDHTTVMHGCEKISQEINTDARLRSEVLKIRDRLYQRTQL